MAAPANKRRPESQQIDLELGLKLRNLRRSMGLSQQELASRVDLTFQQIQKYEHGLNRIAASTLVRFAQALEIPVTTFYEQDDSLADSLHGLDSSREVLELIRAYKALKNPEVKHRVRQLLFALVDSETE